MSPHLEPGHTGKNRLSTQSPRIHLRSCPVKALWGSTGSTTGSSSSLASNGQCQRKLWPSASPNTAAPRAEQQLTGTDSLLSGLPALLWPSAGKAHGSGTPGLLSSAPPACPSRCLLAIPAPPPGPMPAPVCDCSFPGSLSLLRAPPFLQGSPYPMVFSFGWFATRRPDPQRTLSGR